MKYMIVIDLDDTLLNNKKTITKENIEIIKKLKDLGHYILLATGRAFHGAIDFYNELNLNTLLITDNGALISNPSNNNFNNIIKKIPKNIFTDMLDNTLDTIASASINKDSNVYSHNYSKELDYSFNGAYPKEVFEIDYYKLPFDPMNLAVAVYANKKEKFEAYFKNNQTIDARHWGSDTKYSYYDIHLRSVSKASAIVYALNYYNVDINNLITFGDGVNDTEMLALTKHGTAMLNAKDTVKEHANNITKYDYNNSGVGKHLKDFFDL
ncbi:MAG TPA: Cof-type HAD-IIB family hydrolase [Acholeplasmataceae bacterium]|nr:Cof-type HAD-IIB family hydrolase [Acholeplasmataceae bacterium]